MKNYKRCKEKVFHSWQFGGSQCSRKSVKDGYCKQHHPDAIKKREKKSEETSKKNRRMRGSWYIGDLLDKDILDEAKKRGLIE